MDKEHSTELSIELDEKTASGVYSNLAIINHSNTEFVIDYVSVMPGVPKAKVQSRIILTPHNAKRLLKALADNIQKFEKSHGAIEEEVPNSIPLFGQQGKA
ncbi:DUF3467 domain-containing protein [Capnocytophaga catalasegens]|uniref:DUF3467 domain-containing protein n=1 Tax=Capnocytophaga catalasegens TaxID=1004260 RepID=A0AAV5AWD7_9FLAO|nr:DUF3467 domain-containing protein [Capnocytophaga catalasegens]GIZ14929.1 hypothetical protein RCZ03_09290 [Capnocytophaga catalasegens]GJM49308.1 hypothetical protein RCZ15_02830 [Capnocytophaga catalasegens]GJM52459.1 hypothetical protein RCZ16_07760 [Capnocytophaga catalasegens]